MVIFKFSVVRVTHISFTCIYFIFVVPMTATPGFITPISVIIKQTVAVYFCCKVVCTDFGRNVIIVSSVTCCVYFTFGRIFWIIWRHCIFNVVFKTVYGDVICLIFIAHKRNITLIIGIIFDFDNGFCIFAAFTARHITHQQFKFTLAGYGDFNCLFRFIRNECNCFDLFFIIFSCYCSNARWQQSEIAKRIFCIFSFYCNSGISVFWRVTVSAERNNAFFFRLVVFDIYRKWCYFIKFGIVGIYQK